MDGDLAFWIEWAEERVAKGKGSQQGQEKGQEEGYGKR